MLPDDADATILERLRGQGTDVPLAEDAHAHKRLTDSVRRSNPVVT